MLLLAFHQKLKLKREKAQLTLSMARRTTRINRLQKNIQNKQKYYTSLMTTVENQANQMKNAFNLQMQQQLNGNFNPFNNSGQGGVFLSYMSELFKNGIPDSKDSEGKIVPGIKGEKLKELYSLYQLKNSSAFKEDKDGNYTYGDGKTCTSAELSLMMQAVNQAQSNQSSAQYNVTMMTNQYQNNVSIWVEMQKAQIEAEQEQVIDALQYEETMEEMDKEYEETRLAEIKEELESYDQLLKDEIKESTPHFGLS